MRERERELDAASVDVVDKALEYMLLFSSWSSSIQPQNWLELMTTLPLKDIVYINIGVGYQVSISPLTACCLWLINIVFSLSLSPGW